MGREQGPCRVLTAKVKVERMARANSGALKRRGRRAGSDPR